MFPQANRRFVTQCSSRLIASLLLSSLIPVAVTSLLLQLIYVVQRPACPEGLPPTLASPCPAQVMDLLPVARLRAVSYRELADQLGTVDWDTYAASPAAHAGKRVLLANADFARGTLRVTAPAYLQLTEDVTFSPNPADDYLPLPTQPEYQGEAYALGFFAAIAFEAPNITLDGQGFMLQQGLDHYLQQRFFALLELGDRPFIPPQGPANFGSNFTAATHAVVTNLHLGLSSHHGVHGNLPAHVYLHRLNISDYEIAAVSLNGATYLVQEELEAMGNLRDIPISAAYSHARYIKPLVHRMLYLLLNNSTYTDGLTPAEGVEVGVRANALAAAMATLSTQLDEVFADLVTNSLPAIDPSAHPAARALFANPHNLNGGTAYGLLYHGEGAAVNGFTCDQTSPSSLATHHTLLYRSRVQETYANVSQVVTTAYCPYGNGNATGYLPCYPQIGPIGEVLRVTEVVDAFGAYVPGNALFETQIAMARLLELVPLLRPLAPTLEVSAHLLAWVDGNVTLHELIGNGTLTYYRNSDAMFHVNKGVMGIRLDGGMHHCMVDVEVDGVVNVGTRRPHHPCVGENATDAYFLGFADGGHPLQFPQRGYLGSHARGVSLAATRNVHLERVLIQNVHSELGWARGLDVFHGVTEIHELDVLILNVTASTGIGSGYPPTTTGYPPITTGWMTPSAWSHCASSITSASMHIEGGHVDTATMCSGEMLAQCASSVVFPEAETQIRCTPPLAPRPMHAEVAAGSGAHCPYRAYEARPSGCPMGG